MKAIILTGGKSSRMGQDKASLKIGGVTQLDRILSIVRPLTDEIFLSVAHDHTGDAHLPTLPDLEPGPGPLGGLQAAFDHDPDSLWLVIACDLPLIQQADLQILVDHHEISKDATCFLNPLDNHPEPLCALYSPSAAVKLTAVLEKNQRCARRFLASLDRNDRAPSDSRALLNLNRPEHLVELEHLHQNGATEKEVTVEYFAKLSQEAATDSEVLRTSAATLAGLWEELRLKHHFSLDLPHVKPAVDNEFSDWTDLLSSGQTIAFMPPFAGG
ncbi:MAG: molybdopterin-guanine dinucleotide biosynthesis protein A [Akkermansiaceae bacterium]|jgi:molybdopterin-guanine dinucleotide biosynthesis protein A|tara:strand:- start:1800 stop:2615 length:816 start_codon:yes stop_codon:yes gene_type:complete